jgi:hypothetical protein
MPEARVPSGACALTAAGKSAASVASTAILLLFEDMKYHF